MSWLSRALGLDAHPTELAAVNAVGNAALTVAEANNPDLANTVNAITTVASTLGKTTTVSTVISAIIELDAAGVAKLENAVLTAVNVKLAAAGLSPLAVEDLDNAILAEIASFENAPA